MQRHAYCLKVVGEDHIFLPQEAETYKQVSQTSGLSYDSLLFYLFIKFSYYTLSLVLSI